ncbi:MAG: quinone oxidoreductase [Alphaproteobacteria bacterium]|nr:quinone oxidoreductase [Alphaproteobacteria bacterium]
MPKAIRLQQTGGPEVMRWEDVQVGDPGPGQISIRHTAIGLNYIDTYHRAGIYPIPMPNGLGLEAAGVVVAVGKGVKDLKKGDRVAYASAPPGAYSEERLYPADRVVKIPAGISDRTAAAMMLKGMTAQYLIKRTYKVKKGDTVLLHAAAGGVGLILCQWLKALGVKVIGTVGSKEKAALAKKHGCTYPVVYTEEDFVEAVKKITKGRGVPVVYDGVGKSVFMKSLDCLQPFGMGVNFGNASGVVEPFPIGILAAKGSLFVTRPTLVTYTAKREDLVATAKDLFAIVKSGKVKIRIDQEYALKDAARAHQDLEARKTTGSTVLIP